jgi:hypothetical protein
MKTILVLGDCQSNGNNCLSGDIVNDDAPRTWSLRFHNDFRSVFKWYLKHRKENKVTEPMSTGNMESVVWNYLWEEEQKAAWPNLLNVPNVVNISINGGHFIGHHKRLKQYLAENPKPDHVLVTDYTFSHIAHSFKHNNQRYVFERENYVDDEWNPDRYPVEVHRKRLNGIAFQKSQSKDWHIRRHRNGYNMLIKFLNSQSIKWTTVRFGDPDPNNSEIFKNLMHPGIDCTEYGKQYMSTEGENAKIKLSMQKKIAETVQEYLNSIVS